LRSTGIHGKALPSDKFIVSAVKFLSVLSMELFVFSKKQIKRNSP